MTVLVDTSVWSAALRRKGDATIRAAVARHVDAGEVRVHPWVLGELVLGGLSPAARISLSAQRPAAVVPELDVLALIDAHAWTGRRIGWVDAQLLACAVTHGHPLWTLDQALGDTADQLGCRFAPA